MVAIKEKIKHVLLLRLYIFLYMLMKHVVNIQALILQGEWEKFAIFNLVYKSMGHRERNMCNLEWMSRFVDRLLSGSYTKK